MHDILIIQLNDADNYTEIKRVRSLGQWEKEEGGRGTGRGVLVNLNWQMQRDESVTNYTVIGETIGQE